MKSTKVTTVNEGTKDTKGTKAMKGTKVTKGTKDTIANSIIYATVIFISLLKFVQPKYWFLFCSKFEKYRCQVVWRSMIFVSKFQKIPYSGEVLYRYTNTRIHRCNGT